jgi:putative Mg2+ transporter-C (MgtC) family protein
VTLADAVLRLFCAFIAGTIIGYNRGEQGKAAGLRTTLLVCLAAAVAMLQLNYLLSLAGRSPDSFVVNDLMRLPLGILTGVGFIGAGAILRRRNIVIGVTTAATLWYVTVIGLCFGGDQIILGWLATALGCIVLWAMKPLENLMVTEHDAKLTLAVDDSGPAEHEIYGRLRDGGIEVMAIDLAVGRLAANTPSESANSAGLRGLQYHGSSKSSHIGRASARCTGAAPAKLPLVRLLARRRSRRRPNLT